MRLRDAPVPYFRLVVSPHMSGVADCGICAIGTITGRTYEDVVAVADRVSTNWKRGLWLREMRTIAGELGVTLSPKRRYDLEGDTGVLDLHIPKPPRQTPARHVVVLNAGTILDSDATIWDAHAYLDAYRASPKMLLRLY